MRSEQNGWKGPVMLVCVLPSPRPLLLETRRAAEPSQSPSSAEVRWTARAGCWGLSCEWRNRMHLAHWTHQCSPTSKGLLFLLIHKAILFLSENLAWYIYTQTYISTSLSIQCFYYTRNPAAPTYAFLVNFIWLKTHTHTKGWRVLLGLEMIVPWVTHGRKPVSNGQYTRQRGVEGQGASRLGGSVNRASALKGVCVFVSLSHRKLEDSTVKSCSTSYVLPPNLSQSTDTSIANPQLSAQQGAREAGARRLSRLSKSSSWLELPGNPERLSRARSVLTAGGRGGNRSKEPTQGGGAGEIHFWKLVERKLKRATAEPFFRYSKFKLFK